MLSYLNRMPQVDGREKPALLLQNTDWDDLSMNIWLKFLENQQSTETYRRKILLWKELHDSIRDKFPICKLYIVGSTVSGFGSDNSDIDLCLTYDTMPGTDRKREAIKTLSVLKTFLNENNNLDRICIINATVPILRITDIVNHFEIELNVNGIVGIRNTHLLYCYSKLDWRLQPLVLVVKLWAKFHEINSAKDMGISSYSLELMVIHFLQFGVKPYILPCLHKLFPYKFKVLEKRDGDLYLGFGIHDVFTTIPSKNNSTLGELLANFFRYYANFDYNNLAISVRTGETIPIDTCKYAKSFKNTTGQWGLLCIEEPFDLTNTAKAVRNEQIFSNIIQIFKNSAKIANETKDLNLLFQPFVASNPNEENGEEETSEKEQE